MAIYIITILILFVFSITEVNYHINSRDKKWMIYFVYFLLVTSIGFRWETGTDWEYYLSHFEGINDFYSILFYIPRGFEVGYSTSILFIKQISQNYSFFLLIHAIVYYFLIIKSFQRFTPYLFLSLLLFYALTMGMLGSNRQLIALAIGLFALRYIIEKKAFLFFLFIFIAISFHNTAVIFVIYYFLNREIKPKLLFVLIIGSFILGNTFIGINLFNYFGEKFGGVIYYKVMVYSQQGAESMTGIGLTLIGLIKRLVFLSIFYYNRRKISELLPFYNIILNGYIIGIVFYFLFKDILLILVSRGSLYFTIMESLLIASQMLLVKRKENKTIFLAVLLVFSLIFFYQSILAYPDLFLPYKGIFINADFDRMMY